MNERTIPEQDSLTLDMPKPPTPITDRDNMITDRKTKYIPDIGYPKYKRPEIFDENATEIYPTSWGRISQTAHCKFCHQKIESLVVNKIGIGGLIAICCFSASGACCWIPCLVPYFKDTIHYCPRCNIRIGCRSFI
ncbi:unnamed protein product [Blepharisma stoltei]|uniref:LITAF domain-containing protein n=1 Tax=Blepharisma stoltei TaxID=1481888 RepID=A0AAU9KAM2_9CILI|nr:unnamed protein product [Blepharisma stoltei]